MRSALRLVPAALALWVVAAVLVGIPSAAVPVAVVAVTIGVSAAVAARRCPRGPLAHVALAGALCALGAAFVAVQAPQHDAEPFGGADGVAQVTGTARLLSAGASQDGRGDEAQLRFRATAKLSSSLASADGLHVDLIVPGAAGAKLGIGDGVSVSGRLVANGRGDAVAARVYARGIEKSADAPPPLAFAGAVRRGFAERAATLPGDGGRLLPGLTVGDDSAVSPGLNEAMRRASLSHLTAVSGAIVTERDG